MGPVENNFCVGQRFTDGQTGTAHLLRHGLPLFPSSRQTFQKRPNALAAASFNRVKDPAGAQVGRDKCVNMAYGSSAVRSRAHPCPFFTFKPTRGLICRDTHMIWPDSKEGD